MAALIVDDVTDIHGVTELIDYLARSLANGTTEGLPHEGTFTLARSDSPTPAQLRDIVGLDEQEACTDPLHQRGCSCIKDATSTDPRQGVLVDSPRHQGPTPFVPCPDRGRHEGLTECWMCWNDVHCGTISVDEALFGGTHAL